MQEASGDDLRFVTVETSVFFPGRSLLVPVALTATVLSLSAGRSLAAPVTYSAVVLSLPCFFFRRLSDRYMPRVSAFYGRLGASPCRDLIKDAPTCHLGRDSTKYLHQKQNKWAVAFFMCLVS